MDKETVIQVEHVSKKYCKSLKRSMLYGGFDISRNMLGFSSQSGRLRKDEFWALKDITFEVKKGESLGIIGPNGSGKTTLLKLLNGIFWPDQGKISVKGRAGVLIEVGAGFHPLLTGKENIYINGAILGMTKEEVNKKFEAIVEFSDIGDFLDTPVKYYSSGMLVRLGFAVAVHSKPDILLIDEVLAVGDIQFQVKCFRKMREYKEMGKTTILVTHDMGAIQKYTERVILLHKGMIECIAHPKNVVNKYLSLMSRPFERGVSIKRNRFDRLEEFKPLALGHEPNFHDLEDLCPLQGNYNKDEFRYGDGAARIVDFKILNREGEVVSHAKSMDVLRFRVKVKFYEDIEKPIFGLIIKTKDGIELYATNTLYNGMEFVPRKKGEEPWIEYWIHLNLQAGDYFFSAGVSEWTPISISPLDRRNDIAYFTVLPLDKSMGLVNMEVTIQMDHITESAERLQRGMKEA